MRRAVATLVLVGACGVLAPAGAAAAAEPHDAQLLVALVGPADPAFAEITDAADPAHSGPLDAARLAALGVTPPDGAAAGLRGAAVRGYTDGTRRVVSLGLDLTDGATARRWLDGLGALGEPFDVQGIPGALGRVGRGDGATAFVAFVLASRSFFVAVGGADPGHALLQETALLVASTSATAMAGELTGGGGGDVSADPEAASADPGPPTEQGWRATASDALGERDVRLALAAVAALALFVLARRARPAPAAAPPPSPLHRGSAHGWQQTGGWEDPEAWTPGSPTRDQRGSPGAHSGVALGGPVAGADLWGSPDAGWGDDGPGAPPAPPAVASRSAFGGAPAALPAPAAPSAPTWTSATDGDVYSFPGAPDWPEDAGA